MKREEIVKALNKQMAVATGCTEPVAIAYAGAVARSYAEGEIVNIILTASTNIIKNAFVVGIPGTDFTGLKYAVAIGCMCNDPSKKLAVLESLDKTKLDDVQKLVDDGKVNLIKSDSDHKFYIEVNLITTEDIVNVVITEFHTNITKITKNGKVIFTGRCESGGADTDEEKEPLGFDMEDIYEYCTKEDVDKIPMIKEAIKLNSAICKEGLENGYGIEVGRTMKQNVEKGLMADSVSGYAMMVAAAGSDARMAGVSLPVMSNSGSGNQGIAATMPTVAVWEKIDGKDEEKLIRACAISNLATIHIKEKFGVLSALCGAVVAGAGSACGITYLLGGTFEQIQSAIQNTLGNVSGMVCDGAKGSCALKISTCTNAAMQAAMLALNNHTITSNEGMVDQFSEKTIENLAKLGNDGSGALDKAILTMILSK